MIKTFRELIEKLIIWATGLKNSKNRSIDDLEYFIERLDEVMDIEDRKLNTELERQYQVFDGQIKALLKYLKLKIDHEYKNNEHNFKVKADD